MMVVVIKSAVAPPYSNLLSFYFFIFYFLFFYLRFPTLPAPCLNPRPARFAAARL
jgi:hypothetical protein